MAHVHNDDAFVTAYDTRTGQKLPNKIPRAHLDIFPHLSLTPSAKAADQPKSRIPDFIKSERKADDA